MTQQINLFNLAFRKQRLTISIMTVVYCTAVTLLVMVSFQTYFYLQIKQINKELQSVQKLVQAQRAYVDRVRSAGNRRTGVALEAEIAQFESELKLARASEETLKNGVIAYQQGFSDYLRAFSRQSLGGLWLTGFTIAGGGEISIQGRVTHAELVPNYIQRLNQEQVLQGRTFASLSLSTPKAEPAAADKSKAQQVLPRYLNFSLTTVEPLKSVAGLTP